jgi:hypothetical protein
VNEGAAAKRGLANAFVIDPRDSVSNLGTDAKYFLVAVPFEFKCVGC